MQPADLKKQISYCHSRIDKLTAELKKYPPGTLKCYPNGKYYTYYIIEDGKEKIYAPKKDKKLRFYMAQKRILEACLQDCRAELCAYECCLQSLQRNPANHLNRLLADEGMQKILKQPDQNAKVKAWLKEPYPKNPNYPEHLTVPTVTGEKVRSKSEAMIVQMLHSMKIPFHYEQQLVLNGQSFYPDFTLMRPEDGKIFIVELFGMIDNPGYAGNTCGKLHTFMANGYYPDVNLLCFYETSDHPLDIVHVENTLKRHFNL